MEEREESIEEMQSQQVKYCHGVTYSFIDLRPYSIAMWLQYFTSLPLSNTTQVLSVSLVAEFWSQVVQCY
jgi:hypothetical protein